MASATPPPGDLRRARRVIPLPRRTPIHTPVGDVTSHHAAVPGGIIAVAPEFTTTPRGTRRHFPAGLENRRGRQAPGGSNPSPSAKTLVNKRVGLWPRRGGKCR